MIQQKLAVKTKCKILSDFPGEIKIRLNCCHLWHNVVYVLRHFSVLIAAGSRKCCRDFIILQTNSQRVKKTIGKFLRDPMHYQQHTTQVLPY